MVSILINNIQHEQYFFSFRFTLHHPRASCLIIGLIINAMAVTITVKGQRWRLLIYALRNFLLRNNVTCFQKQPSLFLKVLQVSKENTCIGVFFLEMMKLYEDICSAWIKVDYLDIATTFINFNSFANFPKTIFAII